MNPMEILDLKDRLVKLEPGELRELYQMLMEEGKLDYPALSAAYVGFLEGEKRRNGIVICKAGMWLSSYWGRYRGNAKGLPFLRAATAYWLLKTGVMRGAGVEAELKAFLEENPYEEDEYGMPKTELRG